MIKIGIFAAFLYVMLITVGAVRSNTGELSRAVVLRFLAERGFVAGRTLELDRAYTLRSVTVTAHGGGEFTVRFKAQ